MSCLFACRAARAHNGAELISLDLASLPSEEQLDWIVDIVQYIPRAVNDDSFHLPRVPSLTARLRHISATAADAVVRTARRVSPFGSGPATDGFVSVPLDSPELTAAPAPDSPGAGEDEEASLWGEKVRVRVGDVGRREIRGWENVVCGVVAVAVSGGVAVGVWALVEYARRDGGV